MLLNMATRRAMLRLLSSGILFTIAASLLMGVMIYSYHPRHLKRVPVKKVASQQKSVSRVVRHKPAKVKLDVNYLETLNLTEAQVWVYNKTAADYLRNKLENCCNASRSFLVTKANTPLNSTMEYGEGNRSKSNVTREIWERLLEDTPWKYKQYANCSVVGSSGFLKHSGCGKAIDTANFVFRCNVAPVDRRFVADVGNKTNLVTLNPTIVRDRYYRLPNATIKSKFVEDMSSYGDAYVWTSAFSYMAYTNFSFSAQTTLQEYNSSLSTVFGNPDFMWAVNEFWKSNGIKARRISTGLFLASAALAMCEEVHLYGFWPFHVDRNNVTLTEHYYDNSLPSKVHNLPDEFRKLLQLHKEGILELRTDACSRRTTKVHNSSSTTAPTKIKLADP